MSKRAFIFTSTDVFIILQFTYGAVEIMGVYTLVVVLHYYISMIIKLQYTSFIL